MPHPPQQPHPLRGARRVLLCLRYGIGDVVMQSSVFPWLRRALEHVHLTYLGSEPAMELLREAPFVDHVHSYQALGLEHWGDAGEDGGRVRARAWLSNQRFDAILDPLSAPPAVREPIWELNVPTFEADRDAIRQSLELGANAALAIRMGAARGWGVPMTPGGSPSIPLLRERDRAAELLAEVEAEGVQPVGIALGASTPLKSWPEASFAELTRGIVDEEGGPVVVFTPPGGNGVEPVFEADVKVLPPLPLPVVVAAMERCRLLVCNDTGLMHLGAALQVPVLAIFGPSRAHLYHPGNRWDRVVESDLPCSYRLERELGPPDCIVRGRCLLGHRSCIDAVDVEAVHEVLRGMPSYSVPLPAGRFRR